MSSNNYGVIINNFIGANGLNEDMYNKLNVFVHQILVASTKPVKINHPEEAASVNQLKTKCNLVILKKYCKENNLRTIGKKDQICERVWRFVERKSETDDFVQTIEKKVVNKERHPCSCMNKKNNQCKNTTVEQYNGQFMCIGHMKACIKAEISSETPTNPTYSPN